MEHAGRRGEGRKKKTRERESEKVEEIKCPQLCTCITWRNRAEEGEKARSGCFVSG